MSSRFRGGGDNVDMVVDMTDSTIQEATEVSKRIKDGNANGESAKRLRELRKDD